MSSLVVSKLKENYSLEREKSTVLWLANCTLITLVHVSTELPNSIERIYSSRSETDVAAESEMNLHRNRLLNDRV